MPYPRPGCGRTSHSIDEASQHWPIVDDTARGGTFILLVEQDVTIALYLCHRAFVMDMGRIVGSGAELLADPIVGDAYLGVLEEFIERLSPFNSERHHGHFSRSPRQRLSFHNGRQPIFLRHCRT
jgi:energy-coupling factor transporter ATP-binding protein EcfA2